MVPLWFVTLVAVLNLKVVHLDLLCAELLQLLFS